VLGDGCGFAGAGARLDYDRFVFLESLIIQEIGNICCIPGLLFPAGGQIIDGIDVCVSGFVPSLPRFGSRPKPKN
jgi:hypothetical protein